METRIENDLFLRACRREPVPRTPVWIMRQAGRYLPEYRSVREQYDFLTMVRTPEIVADVTVQPVEIINVDAAVLFSDIMVIPEAMGMSLEMVEGRGPVLHDPVRTAASVDALRRPDVYDSLGYVLDGIRATKERLRGRVPLIGFSGSPWTLFAYMVEGSGSKDFRHAKALAWSDPGLARRLLDEIAAVVCDYLVAQVEAGVDAIQIFDTWGGVLPPADYRRLSLEPVKQMIESRLGSLGVPIIVFSKGCSHSLAEIGRTGDVVGVDWATDIGYARRAVGEGAALQGNLDPTVLFADADTVRKRVRLVLEQFGEGEGHVFNLGHGILPQTPVDNVHVLVETVAQESPRYHIS